MDFSKFAERGFDAKTWINGALAGAGEAGREEVAAGLAMKLQLFIGEVNKSLEETSAQILTAMPRLLRELETMQGEALLLQSRMQAVQQDVRKVETKTTLAMEVLLKIHAQKSEIARVEAALREMENWSSLTADMEEVFSSGDVEAMAQRLQAVQTSVQVIGAKAPDAAEKADFVERLKDQFFAAVSPALIGAFTGRSPDQVLYYKAICADLGRPQELLSYYRKCLKMEVAKGWAELLKDDGQGLERLFTALFDSLLSTWSAELSWCETCGLDEPPAVVAQALAKALDGLDPSLESTLRDRLDLEEEKLGALVTVKQQSGAFLASLATSVEGAPFEALTEAVYAPLLPFIAAYQQYQQSLLLEKLNALELAGGSGGELFGAVETLEAGVESVFDEALGAVDQCALLTGPFGLPLLIKALATYLANFASQLRRLVDSARPAKVEGEEGGPARPAQLAEDWPRFAALLQLLTATGTAFLRLERLEEALGLSFAGLRHSAAHSLGLEGAGEEEETEAEAEDPFAKTLLSEPSIRDAIHQLLLQHSEGEADGARAFLADSAKQLGRVNQKGIRLVAEQMYAPLEALLRPLPKLPAWAATKVGDSQSASLPAFALSPHEYITQVGAYLMTLAHQLEPFLSEPRAGLEAALSHGSLPHLSRAGRDAAALMESAGRGIMARFVDAASRIPALSGPGTQQLLSDIDYLSNVVEDVGLEPSETLASLRDLLRMDPKTLNSPETQQAHPAPLIAEVKAMRRL